MFFFSGVSVDGQYCSKPFIDAIHKLIGSESASIFKVPVMWDFPHLLNLAILDLLKEDNSTKQYLELFIRRCNLFSKKLGHGKNNAMLKKVANDINLKLHMPLIYKMQG